MYLHKPNRRRWRACVRAGLGRKWARSWRYRLTKDLGRDWPHQNYVEYLKCLRNTHEVVESGNLCDLFDDGRKSVE